MANTSRSAARDKRHARLRKRISGTSATPASRGEPVRPARLRAGRRRHAWAGRSRPPPPWRPTCARLDGDKTAKAKRVGELVAERAKAAGIDSVVFDRGGNKYAGRVAAVADGAREGGLSL